MNIIVVDDEAAALGTFLYSIVNEEKLKYQMFQLNPLKCLDYVKSNVTDAAFLDICMPEIDGVELAEKLIKINPNISIVVISGYQQDEKTIRDRIGDNLIGFCYKPYKQADIFRFIAEANTRAISKREITIKTFGGFEVFVNGETVKFNSAKSKELLALLVDKNGLTLEMNEAVDCLWENKDSEHGKRLYRDAVFRLRMALKSYNLYDIVDFSRAKLSIKTECIQCDLWQYINEGKGVYMGNYMNNYEWSTVTQAFIENLKR